MRKAGVFKRPYVLRAYAETQLIIAESKGEISHPYLQFVAGHKGDIEARYSTNKGRLPPQMIEDIRVTSRERANIFRQFKLKAKGKANLRNSSCRRVVLVRRK